jgi:4-carboxymuconolactone decarboxylase
VSNDDFAQRAWAERRAVLSDEYVDRVLDGKTADELHWQDFVTRQAWGAWTTGDLPRRERSLIVLAIVAALGRTEEFELHLRGARRNGVTDREIDTLILHMAAYAGAPAGLAARRAAGKVRQELGPSDTADAPA